MSLLSEELRARIGSEATYVAPESLGRAALRYYAEAIGDDNPLYVDEEVARAHGLEGVIAPPTLICDTNQFSSGQRDAEGYAGHDWGLEVPGTTAVRGGHEYTFHRDVRPGDVVTVTWRLVDLSERVARSGAAMLVVTSEARYTDADGCLLAENVETLLYVERR